MNIRNAILAAADHIERNPGEFNFSSCAVPSAKGCGTPGCAVGWITLFSGHEQNNHGFRQTIRSLVGADNGTLFYGRLRDIEEDWMHDAQKCADALRVFADSDHPATDEPIRYPDWRALASAPMQDMEAQARREAM